MPEENWAPPMNALEQEEDPHGIWSKWSNRELSKDYQTLFARFDLLIMIQVPNMDTVYKSRWLQEQKLASTISDPDIQKRLMTEKEVYRFVMHYERITRTLFEEVPKHAQIVLNRDAQFSFSFVKTPWHTPKSIQREKK